jgi:sugar phosphate isomerase/epimerase
MTEERTLTRRGLIGAGAGLTASALLGANASKALGTGARVSGQTTVGTARASGGAPPPALLPPGRIGIQLYSVRDQIDSVGFAKVFEVLAKIGYKNVEFAGYTQALGPITPKQIRQLLQANGLTAIGSHLPGLGTPDDATFQRALDDAQTIGIPQVGISFEVPSGTTTSGWKALADQWNHLGALAHARGMRFYLHNHFQEWALCPDNPTKRGEDILLAETDPKLVWFEMDIYWAYVGQWQSGQVLHFDPLTDYAIPYRNRYLLFHLKDGKPDASGGFTDALDDIVDDGEGVIDLITFFSKLFQQASGEQDRHWYIQERDNAGSHPRGSLAASQISYLYMRYGIAPGLGFGGLS